MPRVRVALESQAEHHSDGTASCGHCSSLDEVVVVRSVAVTTQAWGMSSKPQAGLPVDGKVGPENQLMERTVF